MQPSFDNELQHYGVLGMKWGVHRSRKDSGFASTEKRKLPVGTNIDGYDPKTNERLKKQTNPKIRVSEKRKNKFRKAFEKKVDPKVAKIGKTFISMLTTTSDPTYSQQDTRKSEQQKKDRAAIDRARKIGNMIEYNRLMREYEKKYPKNF